MIPLFVTLDEGSGANPRTVVASGAFTAPGTSAPFSVAGNAGVWLWGIWQAGFRFTVSRSTDGGTTWADSADTMLDASYSDAAGATTALNANSALVAGSALYTVRLDGVFPGGVLNWAVAQ